MRTLKRTHESGTNVELTHQGDYWRIHINLREANHNPMTITGYMARTLEDAKKRADQEILKYHTCNGQCQDWIEA